MKNVRFAIGIVAICLLLASCNGYEKLLKSSDYAAKYEAAMRYYNNNSYSKAIQLFENLTLYYRGKENAEDILWYYSQALFKEKDYYTASYQFKRFSRQYPYSERVEEAIYMSAYCKYLESPAYSLDQTTTKMAIEELESFAERWPKSVYMPEVNRMLDELQGKIMLKEYEIAYGYYVVEQYHAAYQSLKNFLNTYPDAPMKEDAMFYILRSGYLYAIGSREDKQRERLQQVVSDFDRYSTTFSNGKYTEQAQAIYTKTRAALAQIEKEQSLK